MMGVAPSFESERRAIMTQQVRVQGLQQSERLKIAAALALSSSIAQKLAAHFGRAAH